LPSSSRYSAPYTEPEGSLPCPVSLRISLLYYLHLHLPSAPQMSGYSNSLAEMFEKISSIFVLTNKEGK
jgi:hypothetical protein